MLTMVCAKAEERGFGRVSDRYIKWMGGDDAREDISVKDRQELFEV